MWFKDYQQKQASGNKKEGRDKAIEVYIICIIRCSMYSVFQKTLN